ncbi:MBL fold metallo-hydrolase [Roseococcus sp. DSY-14]|uniref:MBL fold metallo-hydrolase n=1 Tax=Roseococcus sp. DSY-14 TaxID=3369650 RepID=UPI00387A897F
MTALRVTLLGTGSSQGVPAIGGHWGACDPAEPRNRRTRTSALLECGGTRLLLDAGPDCRAQLLAAGVGALDGVVFTHAHADHVMGLDELRQVNRNTGQPLPAFGLPETLSELQSRFAYAFKGGSRGFFRPDLRATPLEPGAAAQLGALRFTVFEQDHAVMRTLGLRVGGFAYSTDVVRLPEASLAALRGVQTWVVGCFRPAPHPVHAGLEEVRAWQDRIRPARIILTHMGDQMDWASLRSSLPPGIEPGHDGLAFDA